MVKVDLVNRTVTNISDVAVHLIEVITKATTINPGETVTLDPNTEIIEI